jgi:hypothetical protein
VVSHGVRNWLRSMVAAVVLVALASLSPLPQGIGRQDLLLYWSAARLLATGASPYDVASLAAAQYDVRPAQASTLAAWNPPWLCSIGWPGKSAWHSPIARR